MRLVRSWSGGTLALALVAACSGGGGELREETERRRAENAVIDTAAPDAGADSAGEFRLPAFVDTSASAPAAPAKAGIGPLEAAAAAPVSIIIVPAA